MLISELMIPELGAEMAMTRKLLAKIPSEKLAWKPAEGGLQTIGWNANHLAEIAGWMPVIVGQDELDIAPVGGPQYTPPSASTTEEILATFDANLAKSLASLKGVPDSVMDETWTMKAAGQTILSMKKGDCIRKWIFSHASHHRGIVSAYLRMAGVPHTSIFEE